VLWYVALDNVQSASLQAIIHKSTMSLPKSTMRVPSMVLTLAILRVRGLSSFDKGDIHQNMVATEK